MNPVWPYTSRNGYGAKWLEISSNELGDAGSVCIHGSVASRHDGHVRVNGPLDGMMSEISPPFAGRLHLLLEITLVPLDGQRP